MALKELTEGLELRATETGRKLTEKIELYLGFEESAKCRQVEGHSGSKNLVREETDGRNLACKDLGRQP